MKTRLSPLNIVTIIAVAMLVVASASLYTQNTILNEQIQMTAKNNTQLQFVLDNYVNIFGKTVFDDNDGNYQSINTLETKAFIASSVDEFTPVDIVQVGKQYSATATVSRPSGVADYPPLVGYALHVQIKKQGEEDRIAGAWYENTVRVNETIDSGLYWSPQSAGNYTLEVFTWSYLAGGATKAEPVRINFEVVE